MPKDLMQLLTTTLTLSEMQAFYFELNKTKVIPKRKDFDAGAIKYTDFVR